MNFTYSNAVEWTKPFSTDKVRILLDFLANHANKNGVTYASYKTLMRACGTGDRKVISSCLKELQKLKILNCKRRMNQCTKYTLLLEGILEYSQDGHPVPKLATGTASRTHSQLEDGTTGGTDSELGTHTLSFRENYHKEEKAKGKKKPYFNPKEFLSPITTADGNTYSATEVHRVLYWIFRDPRNPNKWYREHITSTASIIKMFTTLVENTRPNYVIPTVTVTTANPACPTCGGTGLVEFVSTEQLPTGEGTYDYRMTRECFCVIKEVVEA